MPPYRLIWVDAQDRYDIIPNQVVIAELSADQLNERSDLVQPQSNNNI